MFNSSSGRTNVFDEILNCGLGYSVVESDEKIDNKVIPNLGVEKDKQNNPSKVPRYSIPERLKELLYTEEMPTKIKFYYWKTATGL